MALTVKVLDPHKLFLSLLSEQNKELFETKGYIQIMGSADGWYRIEAGHAGNVYSYTTRSRPCAHPRMGGLIMYDAMIAQMLLILTDEKEFLRIAL